MSTEHNRLVLQRFDALLGAVDLTELDDLCTPPRSTTRGRLIGGTAWRDTGSSCGLEAVPDDRQHWVELVVVAEGDHVVRFGRRGGAETGLAAPGSAARPRRPPTPFAGRWCLGGDIDANAAFAWFGPPPPCPSMTRSAAH